jgi:hypothetical protein
VIKPDGRPTPCTTADTTASGNAASAGAPRRQIRHPRTRRRTRPHNTNSPIPWGGRHEQGTVEDLALRTDSGAYADLAVARGKRSRLAELEVSAILATMTTSEPKSAISVIGYERERMLIEE